MKGFLIKRGYNEDLIDSQVGWVFNLDRSSVLEDSKKRGLKKDYVDRMVLTLDFHPALLGVHGILRDLQVLTDMLPHVWENDHKGWMMYLCRLLASLNSIN